MSLIIHNVMNKNINCKLFVWLCISGRGLIILGYCYATIGCLAQVADYEQDGPLDYMIKDLTRLIQNNKLDQGAFLYTPHIETSHCRDFVLQCYLREMEVLVAELDLSGMQREMVEIENIVGDLWTNSNITQENNKEWFSCKRCEQYEERPVSDFLSGFKTLLQERISTKKKKIS